MRAPAPPLLLLASVIAAAPACSRAVDPTPEASAATAPAAASTTAAAPEGSAPRSDLNVLLITIDSLRADMPWAGYPRPIAPALTAFAEKAVVYERFYSIASYTAMSLGGLLAGRYPSELPRSGFYFTSYPDGVVFFPDLLRKAGVRTLSGQSHFYFDQRAGFRRSFDVYEMVPNLGADHQTDNDITSPQQLEIALRQLSDKANTDGRFFAWFHFLDPHDKYQPHAGIEWGRTTRDLYDGEVTFTDQHIGKLLAHVEAEPWGARTAVIVSADHGEAFGEHPHCYRHGFEVWDVLTHVPLLIRAPGVTPRRIAAPRSAIDLAPTILELFGVPKDPEMRGTSLVAELRGAPAEPRDVIIDLPRTSNSDRRRALIRGDHKLIALGDDDAFQLFDLRADPGEEKDARWAHPAVFEELKGAYQEWSGKIPFRCPEKEPGLKLRGKKTYRPC